MKASTSCAFLALALSGCASVPGLVGQLEQGDAARRRLAARRLGLMGERASEAVPYLVRALGDEDAEARLYSVIALSLIGTHSPDVVSALQPAVGDEDESVRAMAARALGLALSDAREARIDRARGKEEEWKLLFSPLLGNAAHGPVDVLTKALGDESVGVRSAAAFSLGLLGPDAGEAVPALIKAAREDASVAVRLAAVFALAMQGPDAGEAVATLGELAEGDPSSVVREFASAMLEQLREGQG